MRAKITSGELKGTEFEVSEETIENIRKESKEISFEDIQLRYYNDYVCLEVDDWSVFELRKNGKGRRCRCISQTNNYGLKVDEEGRILRQRV